MRRFGFLFVLVLLAFSQSALAQEAILGTWSVTDAQVGPWYDGGGAKPDADPKILHGTVVFSKDGAKGIPAFECKKVKYTVSTVGPEDLFEGGLKNPAKDAAALGFKGGKITSISEGCLRTDADLEMDIALIDKDTAVFGLNNVIYKMKRKSP